MNMSRTHIGVFGSELEATELSCNHAPVVWIAYAPSMRVAGIGGGLVLALMGAVWLLQGLNSEFVPQSFMTGSRIWIVIGALALVGGLALTRWSWSRR